MQIHRILIVIQDFLSMTKTCIVTGGSSGIGLAICQEFIALNYRVFNLDLNPSDVGEFIACDITDHQAVQNAVASVTQDHNIDALICNAGIHFSGNIEQTSEQDLMRVFDINVKGAYSAIQASLPSMKQHGGSIVLIASDQSLIAKNNSFAYNLSKHAVASMAKTTALDYAEFNITANAICAGTIETPLYHNAIDKYCAKSGADKAQVHREEEQLQPLGRLGQPQEVAKLAAFLASDNARFITGSLQVIDGGYTAR